MVEELLEEAAWEGFIICPECGNGLGLATFVAALKPHDLQCHGVKTPIS